MNRRVVTGGDGAKKGGWLGAVRRPSSSAAPRSAEAAEVQRRPYTPPSSLYVLFVVLTMAAAAVGSMVHLHVRFEAVRVGYEASKARKTQTRLLLRRRELRLELATLKEPGRIMTEAQKMLEMKAPDFDDIIPMRGARKSVRLSGRTL